MERLPLVIAGPTASGKSSLAMTLAEAMGGALICADSRQFYSGMVVGTAGPSKEEQNKVQHYLFHTQDPKVPLDVSGFLKRADSAMQQCQIQRQHPIFVGGTGLYLRSWRFGIDDAPPSDPQVRKQLEGRLRLEGVSVLHAELMQKDPQRARNIHPNDPVRVVRALEIQQLTLKPPSSLLPGDFEKKSIRRRGHHILLWPSLEWLRPRVEARAERMLNKELIKESLALRTALPKESRLINTMGYEEAFLMHEGQLSRELALRQIVKRQWAYARRQRTWFKKENWWRIYAADAPNLAAQILKDLSEIA